jgi:hypothetical protein
MRFGPKLLKIWLTLTPVIRPGAQRPAHGKGADFYAKAALNNGR